MVKRKQKKLPALRLHKRSGQAVVTLTDDNTGRRRDVYLGEHGTPEARAEYDRVIARWLAAGRVLDARPNDARRTTAKPDTAGTVTAVVVGYWRAEKHAKAKPDGTLTTRLDSVQRTLRVLRSMYGGLPASEFGPLALQRVREAMVGEELARSTVNDRTRIIQAAFKWAVAQQIVKPDIYVALSCVRPLKRGELGVKEGRKIRPVDEDHALAILPYVAPPVAALIRLQLLTGARGGELFIMRPMDLDTTGRVWVYRPEHHKGEHRDLDRNVYIGPEAQAIIKPLLAGRALDATIFDPREAGGKAGATAKHNRYDDNSYRRAVMRGCDLAFPAPPPLDLQRVPATGRKRTRLETEIERGMRLTPKQREQLREWRKAHRWHPHQLRHTAATKLRREFGIEAARIVLGHRSSKTTEIYAERDHGQAIDIAAKIG